MRVDVPPLPQYVFKAWCSVKAQGQLYLYSNSKEQGPSWGTNSHSGIQEIPAFIFFGSEGSFPCSQEPTTGSYSESDDSAPLLEFTLR
jgi:hypothetical protein